MDSGDARHQAIMRRYDCRFFLVLITLLLGMAAGISGGCSRHQGCLSAVGSGETAGDSFSVPFVRSCTPLGGPAMLSAVLQYWGAPCSAGDVSSSVLFPDRCADMQFELEEYAKERGFLATGLRADITMLSEQIRNGIPVIVLEQLHPFWLRKMRYSVVTGIDLSRMKIRQQSGRQTGRYRRVRDFCATWSKAGSWMLVVLPPERVGIASVNRNEFLELGLIFERKGALNTALKNFERARQFDETDETVLLHLARVQSRLHNWQPAERYYRELLHRTSEPAPIYLELAGMYLQMRKYPAAQRFAGRAIASGVTDLFTAYYITARALWRTGNAQKAQAYMTHAETAMQRDVPVSERIAFYEFWTEQARAAQ